MSDDTKYFAAALAEFDAIDAADLPALELSAVLRRAQELKEEAKMAEQGTKANERQEGGAHYKAAYQHWDLVADSGMNYFEGQATKYIVRWRKKNGLEDLKKAVHYIDKMIELWEAKRLPLPMRRANMHEAFDKFREANSLEQPELAWMTTTMFAVTVLSWVHLRKQIADFVITELAKKEGAR